MKTVVLALSSVRDQAHGVLQAWGLGEHTLVLALAGGVAALLLIATFVSAIRQRCAAMNHRGGESPLGLIDPAIASGRLREIDIKVKKMEQRLDGIERDLVVILNCLHGKSQGKKPVGEAS